MKKANRGFILHEMLFYLMISTVCFTTIYNELLFTKNLVHQDTVRLLNWHSSMNRLDALLKNMNIVTCTSDKVVILSKANGTEESKEYIIDVYKSKSKKKMLRIRGENSGHMPIFANIKSARFKHIDQTLIIRVTDLNKKVFEYVYKI